jgi:hypothetical protein
MMKTNNPIMATDAVNSERPVLHLSGPKLTERFQSLINGSENDGGIERYVTAVNLKVSLFKEAVADNKARKLHLEDFKRLCAFIAPVRRRIAPWLGSNNFQTLQNGIGDLLNDANDTTTTDVRIEAFCKLFPEDKKHRWVRDLAAELLHYTNPELYPLMNRWVWDSKSNSGVLREIWHGDNVDGMVIDIPDGYETFLVLREELSQFLTDNGVFRDILYYVDLLCAQIYADYICSQGGAFLRTDFSAEEDPMQYTRRMIGLDGVKARSAQTRLKDIDGEAFEIEEAKQLDWSEGDDHAHT